MAISNSRILYSLPSRLTGAREAAGMSKNALADAMGSDVSAVSRIESGDRIPSLQTIANACDALGISLQTFFSDGNGDISQTDLLIALLERSREGIDDLSSEKYRMLGVALQSVIQAMLLKE